MTYLDPKDERRAKWIAKQAAEEKRRREREAEARRECQTPEYAARVGRFMNHSADLDQ